MSLLQDRMRTPVHLGRLDAASVTAAVGNPACGDVLTLHLRIDGDTIREARFESLGSAYQLATASVLCDAVRDVTVQDAGRCAPERLLRRLPDLPRQHHYLARLAIDALRRALDDWRHGSRPQAPRQAADEAGGRAFVRRILGNGRRWSTDDVDAMARAEAVPLPQPTLRFLSDLRHDGVIQGELDMAARGWRWWL